MSAGDLKDQIKELTETEFETETVNTIERLKYGYETDLSSGSSSGGGSSSGDNSNSGGGSSSSDNSNSGGG